jgi:hypothetical protein
MNGLYNVLEVARCFGCSVFSPSSIAVFGYSTPADNTPQDTIQRPNTMYGLTKVTGELLCDYYFNKFGVDVRGVLTLELFPMRRCRAAEQLTTPSKFSMKQSEKNALFVP